LQKEAWIGKESTQLRVRKRGNWNELQSRIVEHKPGLETVHFLNPTGEEETVLVYIAEEVVRIDSEHSETGPVVPVSTESQVRLICSVTADSKVAHPATYPLSQHIAPGRHIVHLVCVDEGISIEANTLVARDRESRARARTGGIIPIRLGIVHRHRPTQEIVTNPTVSLKVGLADAPGWSINQERGPDENDHSVYCEGGQFQNKVDQPYDSRPPHQSDPPTAR
jgi:hypothetical protein